MNILVTGASGFIGSNFVNSIIQNKKYNVFALIRETTDLNGIYDIKNYIIYKNNIKELIDAFFINKIDGVIHLASLFLSTHTYNDVDDLIDSNIRLGTHILEACMHNGVKWLINTSSYWQYYNNMNYSPVALYAATKKAFEDIIQYYFEISEMKVANIEMFDSYGPFDNRIKLFNLLKKCSLNNESLEMTPGEQLLNLVYIDDIIEGYKKAMIYLTESSGKDIYNFSISSDKLFTLKEVVKTFTEIYGIQLKINWGGRKYREREIMNPQPVYPLIPDWKQKYSLYDGLKKVKEAEGRMIKNDKE